MKKELISGSLLIFLLVNVSAAPEISGVTGTFEDGQQITISGNYLGTSPTIYMWDDFEDENYLVGQPVRSCNSDWSDRVLSYPTLVSDSHNRAGSTKHTEFQGAMYEGDSGLMYTHSTDQLSPVFMTCYRRVTTEGIDGTMKWEWIVDSQAGNPAMHYDLHAFGTSAPSIYSTYFTEAVGVRCRCISGSTADDTVEYLGSAQEGQWLRAEYFGIESTPNTADGTIWQSHQLSDTGTFQTSGEFAGGIMTRHCSTYWDRIVFGWYTHGNTEVYDYDDIYIADSRARVEIGNDPVFADCTHREVQGDISSWSDAGINFDLNQGSFASGEQVYVFVVDENGDVSEGSGPFVVGQQIGFDGISITSVSGVIDQGETVTIGGLNFGATGPTIYKWDDFEGDTHVVDGYMGAGPGAIAWGPNQAYNEECEPVVSSGGKTNSGKYLTVATVCGGSVRGFHYDHGEILSPLFVSYWFTWDDQISAVNCKLIVPANPACNNDYYYAGPGVGTTFVKPSQDEQGVWHYSETQWIPTDDLDDSCSHSGGITTWLDLRPIAGDWVRGDFYGEESSANIPDGTVLWSMQKEENGVWIDIFNYDGNVITHAEEDEHWKASVFGRYSGGTTSGYDDIYIANSRARIEIGNDPVFEDSTHREIQIPTGWSDGSITFTVNQGSFHDGDTAYIFVVDENGDASSGKEITFSGTYTGPCHDADTNEDGQLSVLEIAAYVNRWKIGQVSMSDLIDAIKIWKGQ